MSDERAEYLASRTGPPPDDRERLDVIRDILGDEATWSEPPPDVAERVVAAIAAEKRATDQTASGERRRWPLIAAATMGVAAAVVLVLGLVGVFTSPDQQIIALQGTDLEPAATGEAAIRPTESGWWIRLDVDDLPAAARGTYYEGWVWNDDGDGVSIGTFHLRGGNRPIVLWSGVDPADYPSIWVTLEDEDGDPAASERVMMRGRPSDG